MSRKVSGLVDLKLTINIDDLMTDAVGPDGMIINIDKLFEDWSDAWSDGCGELLSVICTNANLLVKEDEDDDDESI